MGATGTITHIDGNKVYAFGHPFFGLGPAQFPLTRAYVYAMLPSLMSSFKISSMGDVIGTMQQDRATAIAGTLGSGPAVVPMSVTLQSTRDDGSTSSRTFNYSVAQDQAFTPLLVYVALANTIGAYERQFGPATFAIKSRTHIKGHNDLALEDVFTGENATLGAATAVAGPVSMLLANDLEPVTVSGLDITVESSETSRTVTIERAWLDEVHPRAGSTVPLKVLTRSYRGEEKISTVPIDIPAHVSGPLSLLVTDGRQLNAMEQRDLRRSLQPQSVAQMIRVLNDTRRNNRIYIRLLNGRPGRSSTAKRSPRCPPPSCPCSKATAMAEATRPSAAPPLANGNCPWARQSPGRGCSRSTSSHAARRAANPSVVSRILSADGCIHVQVRRCARRLRRSLASVSSNPSSRAWRRRHLAAAAALLIVAAAASVRPPPRSGPCRRRPTS